MKHNTNFERGKVYGLKSEIDYAQGGVISKQLIKRDKGNVTLFSFSEGQGLSEHSAPFDALVQILEGEAEIRIGGEPHRLKEGEIIIMPANIPHALLALSDFKMLLTMIKE